MRKVVVVGETATTARTPAYPVRASIRKRTKTDEKMASCLIFFEDKTCLWSLTFDTRIGQRRAVCRKVRSTNRTEMSPATSYLACTLLSTPPEIASEAIGVACKTPKGHAAPSRPSTPRSDTGKGRKSVQEEGLGTVGGRKDRDRLNRGPIPEKGRKGLGKGRFS